MCISMTSMETLKHCYESVLRTRVSHWSSSLEPSWPPSLGVQWLGTGTQSLILEQLWVSVARGQALSARSQSSSSVFGAANTPACALLRSVPASGACECGAAALAVGAAEAVLCFGPREARGAAPASHELIGMSVSQAPGEPASPAPLPEAGISIWNGPLDTWEQPAISRISFIPIYFGDVRQVGDSTALFCAASPDTASLKILNLEYPHEPHWIRPKQVDFGLNTPRFC